MLRDTVHLLCGLCEVRYYSGRPVSISLNSLAFSFLWRFPDPFSMRILFVIRGKLGDSLLAFTTVQAWRERHPEDEIHLLVRKAYAQLIATEARRLHIRLLPLGGRADLLSHLLRLRCMPSFDALAVLWGFGWPVKLMGRWIRARRKIYLDRRFDEIFPETPEAQPFGPRIAPSWNVARLLDHSLPCPERLVLPDLIALHRRQEEKLSETPAPVGLVPLADEMRRSASPEIVAVWLEALARSWPGCSVHLILNSADKGADALIAAHWPEHVRVVRFSRLTQLVTELSQLCALATTDTGLYHLAAAMNLPATVYFGPTEPPHVILSGQRDSRGIRLEVLGKIHCEVKDCQRPYCLDRAISNQAQHPCPTPLAAIPTGCPLRVFPEKALAINRTWDNSPEIC